MPGWFTRGVSVAAPDTMFPSEVCQVKVVPGEAVPARKIFDCEQVMVWLAPALTLGSAKLAVTVTLALVEQPFAVLLTVSV